MHNKHITHFKVENFKRFEQFEMDNIGQFNLIMGDNNVGKTTVLEALLVDEEVDEYVSNLRISLSFKGLETEKNTDFLAYFFHKSTKNSQIQTNIQYKNGEISDILIKSTKYDMLNKKEKEYLEKNPLENGWRKQVLVFFELNKEFRSLNTIVDFDGLGNDYTSFIPFGLSYKDDLVRFYTENIQPSKKLQEELVTNLSLFIPNIEGIEVTKNGEQLLLSVSEKNIDRLIPLPMYGDGAVKFTRILLEIMACKGKRLMIDEIDAGLHYSRYKDFWRALLKIARINDVQLFITTHNLECLQCFKAVLAETEMESFQKEARCISLLQLPDTSVKAYTYHFEAFEQAIDSQTELR